MLQASIQKDKDWALCWSSGENLWLPQALWTGALSALKGSGTVLACLPQWDPYRWADKVKIIFSNSADQACWNPVQETAGNLLRTDGERGVLLKKGCIKTKGYHWTRLTVALSYSWGMG
jgi:hypothetical protein